MRRGHKRTWAVVLGSFDYGDSDRILSFYTEDFGKIRGIAKGARRSRKRFVGRLEPAMHIDLLFQHGGNSELARVDEAVLVEPFTTLRADIERYSTACYLLELTEVMVRQGQRLPGLFSMLVDFLAMLEKGAGPVERFFEIKLLAAAGYMPHLTDCMGCGKEPAGGVFFSPARGGILCAPCSGAESGLVPASPGTVFTLRAAARLETGKLERLKTGAGFEEEAGRMLDLFIKFQTGRPLRTKAFLEKLRTAPFGRRA